MWFGIRTNSCFPLPQYWLLCAMLPALSDLTAGDLFSLAIDGWLQVTKLALPFILADWLLLAIYRVFVKQRQLNCGFFLANPVCLTIIDQNLQVCYNEIRTEPAIMKYLNNYGKFSESLVCCYQASVFSHWHIFLIALVWPLSDPCPFNLWVPGTTLPIGFS